MKRHTFTEEERARTLFSRTKKDGECLLWTGSKHKYWKCEYGITWFNGKKWLSHRLAFYLNNKIDPQQLYVMHMCDNGLCINTDHLVLGTQKANMRDAARKKRLAKQSVTHCPSGHEYTEQNTILQSRTKGSPKARVCRTCKEKRRKERYQRTGQ